MSEKRFINARVDAEEYELFDNERHGEKTTWQELVTRLLRVWLSQKMDGLGNTSPVISAKIGATIGAHSEEEIEVANAAILLFRSKDEPLKAVQQTILEPYKVGGYRVKGKAPAAKIPSDRKRDTG